MSPKQKKIMAFLDEHPTITVTQAVELIGGDVYCNKGFHCGNILRNMVKRGYLTRVSRGFYAKRIPVLIHIETIERPNDPTLRVCQPQWEGSDLSFLD